MGGATLEYPGQSCMQETDSPTHCDRTQAETAHRPLRSRQCLLCSRTTMIAPAPPAAHLPAAEEAERSSRDIPVAVSLGTELRGSSFGGAKN